MKKRLPVVDLHSDLLSFLAYKKGRTPHDPSSRSSFSQLSQGEVKLQTLAIGAITSENSVKLADEQICSFHRLLKNYPDACKGYSKDSEDGSRLHLIAAIENASTFALEEEPLHLSLDRLQKMQSSLGHLFYISLTWNGENRFGGGVGSSLGLKPDGKSLLAWMSGKRIAVDLSHASDKLADEIIEEIHAKGLKIPLMASHSNFRTVHENPRNLPDRIAKEILLKGGLIGMNLFAPFISNKDPEALLSHFAHGLKIGGRNSLSFGADFFCLEDFPHIETKYPHQICFFPEFENSSSYPYILKNLKEKLSLDDKTLEKIASNNALRFLKDHIL